jgi:hypothetical protein
MLPRVLFVGLPASRFLVLNHEPYRRSQLFYERPVPMRPSSFIRIAGILLKRLLFALLFVDDDFAEDGAGEEA